MNLGLFIQSSNASVENWIINFYDCINKTYDKRKLISTSQETFGTVLIMQACYIGSFPKQNQKAKNGS